MRRAVEELVAGSVDERDVELGLEDVRGTGDAAGVAEPGAPRGPVREDDRELVDVVGPIDGLVEEDALAAECLARLAVDLEEDGLHGRELGQGVDDLGETAE